MRSRSPRRGDELPTGALGDQAAPVDDADPIADPFGLLHVVRRVEHGHARAPEGLDVLEDGVAALGVDADRRLVEDEEHRMVEQAGGDVEPALHAARVGVDAVVPAVDEIGELERLVDALPEQSPPEPVEPAEEGEVLPRREVRVEGDVLGHVADRVLAARSWASSRPSSTAAPRSGWRRPQTSLMVVVLPAPFGPRRP